ncbi:MAG: SPOR domain-containing protein [bacterium]
MANEELNELKDKELEVQNPETPETEEQKPGNGFAKFKNALVLVGLALIVVGSFWLSFQLGRRILFPAGGDFERKIVVPIPEPPPAIKALQKSYLEEKQAACDKKMAKGERSSKRKRIARSSRSAYPYKVQAGLFIYKANAEKLAAQLNEKGIDTYLKKTSLGWRVQVGAFKTRSEANAQKANLTAKGFESIILFE